METDVCTRGGRVPCIKVPLLPTHSHPENLKPHKIKFTVFLISKLKLSPLYVLLRQFFSKSLTRICPCSQSILSLHLMDANSDLLHV